MTTVLSDDVDRSTDSLETEAVDLFAQLSGKESSPHVPVFAFSYTGCRRAPALSFVVSNGSLPHWSVMVCPFFYGDSYQHNLTPFKSIGLDRLRISEKFDG